jgi:hypothetical protein
MMLMPEGRVGPASDRLRILNRGEIRSLPIGCARTCLTALFFMTDFSTVHQHICKWHCNNCRSRD